MINKPYDLHFALNNNNNIGNEITIINFYVFPFIPGCERNRIWMERWESYSYKPEYINIHDVSPHKIAHAIKMNFAQQ